MFIKFHIGISCRGQYKLLCFLYIRCGFSQGILSRDYIQSNTDAFDHFELFRILFPNT